MKTTATMIPPSALLSCSTTIIIAALAVAAQGLDTTTSRTNMDFLHITRPGSGESIDKTLDRSSIITAAEENESSEETTTTSPGDGTGSRSSSNKKSNDTSAHNSLWELGGWNISQEFLVTRPPLKGRDDTLPILAGAVLDINGVPAAFDEDDWASDAEEYDEDDEEEYDEDDDDDDDDDEDEYYDEDDGPGADFGVPQIVDLADVIGSKDAAEFNQTAVEENLQQTALYMNQVVWKDDFYIKVRDLCYNYHPLCTAWAAHGECIDNSIYMDDICAPACQRCEQLHYDTRCPPHGNTNEDLRMNIWQPGDLNDMFEHIVADASYNVQILSQPSTTIPSSSEEDDDDAPWVIVIDDFLSVSEAKFLRDMGSKLGYDRNTVSGGMDKWTGEAADNVEDDAITSSSAWCIGSCDTHDITENVFQRVEELTGIPVDYAEHLQLVKYEQGEYYLTHHDYVPYERSYMAGPRMLTVLLYLNDVIEGGETFFSQLGAGGLKIQPKTGRIVLFPNVLNEEPDEMDDRLEHEALPVIQGQKFVANLWLHLRDLTQAAETGCY